MEKIITRPIDLRLPHNSHIRYREDRGFEIGNPQLNELSNEFYTVFRRLARIQSNTREGLGEITRVVANMYMTPESRNAGVTVTMHQDGPVEIIIPEVGKTSKRPRLFAGHLDVVKGKSSNPDIHDGLIRSHGPAVDNKGPVAAMIVATQFIIKNNIPHPPLRLIFTGDEETDGLQIKQVEVGDETMAFIADKSGPIGTIVTGSGGYTGITARIEGLIGEKALEFLGRFDRRMGRNMISRRNRIPSSLKDIFGNREFSVDAISIGPNNSRNTVADAGCILGTVSCLDNDDEERIRYGISTLTASIGASVDIRRGENEQQRIFAIDLHGKAGHTSKAGTREDDGFVSVFSDVLALVGSFVVNDADSPIIPRDEVRINIGSMSGTRRGRNMDISFHGEARYHNGDDATAVLQDLKQLVGSYGGTMEIVEENRAYQLDKDAASVRLAHKILRRNGHTVNVVNRGFGIADANNAPSQWNTVVLSDGSSNPHRSDEAMPIESAVGLIQIFYDLATQ